MTERRHMANAEKVAAVTELTERFQGSSGAVLTEYRGLTVAQLAELRRSLGDHATFAVVKNTLTKIAVTDAGAPWRSRAGPWLPRPRRRRRSRSSTATWSRQPRACATSPGRTRIGDRDLGQRVLHHGERGVVA